MSAIPFDFGQRRDGRPRPRARAAAPFQRPTSRTGWLVTTAGAGLCRLSWISCNEVELVTCVCLCTGAPAHLILSESVVLDGVVIEALDAKGVIRLAREIDPSEVLQSLGKGACPEVARSVRIFTNFNAVVTLSGIQHRMRVLNVSDFGICLEHEDVLHAGDPVQLELHGSVVAGKVQWSTGGRAGLHLDHPIDVPRMKKITLP